MNETWKVLEGMPSWHQRRAGGVCASVRSGFKSREAAEDWADRYRAMNGPHAVAVVMRETEPGV